MKIENIINVLRSIVDNYDAEPKQLELLNNRLKYTREYRPSYVAATMLATRPHQWISSAMLAEHFIQKKINTNAASCLYNVWQRNQTSIERSPGYAGSVYRAVPGKEIKTRWGKIKVWANQDVVDNETRA